MLFTREGGLSAKNPEIQMMSTSTIESYAYCKIKIQPFIYRLPTRFQELHQCSGNGQLPQKPVLKKATKPCPPPVNNNNSEDL